MTASGLRKDLVVLVADGQMEFTMRGLLARRRSLGLRELSLDIFAHPRKDPGCLLRAHEFLRPFSRQYSFALVMLDREGCGKQDLSRESLEAEIEARLATAGWKARSTAIVLDPELESWVWSNSPEVDRALGWWGKSPSLVQWLQSQGFLAPGQAKPKDPKRAMEEALRIACKGRSSAIYRQLAEKVSVQRCTDAAFVKLRATLSEWFGTSESSPENR